MPTKPQFSTLRALWLRQGPKPHTLTETRVQTTSEDMIVEVGTQTTTTTTIAPVVKKKEWTRRSTGPYHQLVREEEEEEGFDQEAGPSAKKLEEGVRIQTRSGNYPVSDLIRTLRHAERLQLPAR